MRGFLANLQGFITSRKLAPVVIAIFLGLYAVIAPFNDETLTVLMAVTKESLLLQALLALVPANFLARLARESVLSLRRKRAMGGSPSQDMGGLFDEEVTIVASVAGFADAERSLALAGYRTAQQGNTLAAWRGFNLFPARALWLLGGCCLFLGILLSLTLRTSLRDALVEGEPLPQSVGLTGRVTAITLKENPGGLLFSRDLAIEITHAALRGLVTRRFGIYPPGLVNGQFLYPRFLGIAALLRFSAPDMQTGISGPVILMIHPPGKEDTVAIEDSPYKLSFRLLPAPGGEDPYITGRFALACRLVSGDRELFDTVLQEGGEVSRNGFTLALPEVRKVAVVDFVHDPGVLFIWGAILMLAVAAVIALVVRIFWPRREVLFIAGEGVTQSFAYAEGRMRGHLGVFHKTLDRFGSGEE
jgi:hypothetical protein